MYSLTSQHCISIYIIHPVMHTKRLALDNVLRSALDSISEWQGVLCKVVRITYVTLFISVLITSLISYFTSLCWGYKKDPHYNTTLKH